MGNIGIIRRHFETVGSTSTWAKENMLQLPRDTITLLTAKEQTAGRGRHKRVWISPAGENIYATYCHFFPKGRPDLANLLQVLSLCTLCILSKKGFQPKLKWPNDLLLSKKKLGGFLAERVEEEDGTWLFVSIGLNVNMGQRSLEKVGQSATSLFAESGAVFDIEELLNDLTNEYIRALGSFTKKGFAPFFDYYKDAVYTPEKISFKDNQRQWEGFMHTINPDGSIVLKLDTGELKTFYSGEI